jgi:death-on-curing protein
MSEELKYIDYDEALVVYRKTVIASGGGLQGVKGEGGIRKVLEFVQNDLYYPTFIDKLT